ncbi:MAG: ferrous iron transport protein A [Anaerolineae bacterium]|nr:ferrous iron transport protein A [Anaerolineae bacterium]
MFPLSLATSGQWVQICDLRGGRGVRMKLSQMGLFPGQVVQVILNDGGPIVVGRDGFQLGLGKGMARQIYVKPVTS